MGSACACPSIENPTTPRPPPPIRHSSQPFTKPHRLFQDINPAEKQNIDGSQDGILLLQNQLSGRIHQFQQSNGLVSDRFDLFWPQHQSINLQKMNEPSKIAIKKSNRAIRVSRNMDMPTPISHDNIKLNIEGYLSQSDKSQEQRQESCLLTQKSHLLSQSLFTDRIMEKNQFYNKHNTINDIQLQQWKQVHRYSYCIRPQELQTVIEAKEFSNNVKIVFQSLANFYKNNTMNLLSYSKNPSGIKLHINGQKRLYPLQIGSSSQPNLSNLIKAMKPLLHGWTASQMIFYLTGWIPEELKMADINNFTGIFERLLTNLEEGNTIIFFSRTHKQTTQQVLLTSIDLRQGYIGIDPCNCQLSVPPMFFNKLSETGEEILVKIEHFVEFFDSIHLSWNPTIYDYVIDRQCEINRANPINKYSLMIPPSSQDIQIRLFLQRHHSANEKVKKGTIVIKLLEYDNLFTEEETNPIRVIQTNENTVSDVFIFESCKQKTQYLLTIDLKNDEKINEDVCYNITLLSFVEMFFDKIKQDSIIKQISLETLVSQENMGFGINSPYFDKNIQFLVETEVDRLLVVAVQAPSDFKYQICLIPNQQGHEILTKIPLETIINGSSISGQKNGDGVFTIKTSISKYILVINSFSSFEGSFKVNVRLHGRNTQKTPTLQLRELDSKNIVEYSEDFKWLPTHSGPRKRLKSNCNQLYQPSSNFTDFFINPFCQKELKKGRYQFFVKSLSFQNWFDSVNGYEYKNFCQPPATSLSVFQVTEDEQKLEKFYRIILDDAFYVPFGIGFWTQEIELEDGMYRFVCPTMEKAFGAGTFGIVKC